MTEEEWLASRMPYELLATLKSDRERQARLLAIMIVEHFSNRSTDPYSEAAVALALRLADGEASQGEREALFASSSTQYQSLLNWSGYQSMWRAVFTVGMSAGQIKYGKRVTKRLQANCSACCDLVRDILGNPFRPVSFSPEWRTSTAVAIAKGMYDSRDFGPMPLLADSLQDAGCEVPEIIDHCRGPCPHVRGCWVVDGVLGKA